MDSETKAVLSEQQHLALLVDGTGWGIARAKLVEKINELQNAFSIEETTPEKMLVDLQSRKLASTILFDWLRDIESNKQVAEETRSALDKGYIFKV